jgi:phosphinothricin acetyltransferase
MSIRISPAQIEDLPRIVEIYNQAILQKGMTADLIPQKVEDKIHWFESHNPKKYPIFVALKNDEIVGWISLSPYREGRTALNRTAEISVYLDNNFRGLGLGSALMQHAVAEAKELGFNNILAIIISSNEKSIGLFTKFNFALWGTLPNVVEIGAQKLNHCYFGLSL